MKLSDEIIKEIAESVDLGFTCYVNPETGDMETMMENNDLGFDLYLDENEIDEKVIENEPGWQKEVRIEIKEQMARIDSWKHCVVIQKPDSRVAFRFMEGFVEEIIPEKNKEMYWNALNWKKPFSNFNNLVHNSDYREEWFQFKLEKLIEYVREELR